MKKLIVGAMALSLSLVAPFAVALDVDSAMKDAAGFKFGDSRKVLIEVEQAVSLAKTDEALRTELAAGLVEILAGDATFEAKRFACRQLILVGDDSAVSALTPLLQDDAIAAHALRALEAMGASDEPATSEAARAALRDAAPMMSVATMALGRLQDAESVGLLEGLMATQPEAIEALAMIGTAESCNALFEAYKKEQTLPLADGCLMCADEFLKGGSTDFAEMVYANLYTTAPANHLKAAALKGLVAVDKDAAREDVLKALRNGDDPAMMRYAVGLMSGYPGEENTKAISDLLADADGETRLALIDALAQRGDRSAAPAITALYEAGDADTRIEIVRALGSIGDVSSATLLVRAAATGDATLRREARASLAKLTADATNDALVKLAGSGEESERAEAIVALGARHATEAKDSLMAYLEDTSDRIFEEVQGAVGIIGDEEDLPALLNLLKDAGATRAKEIKKSIVEIAGRLKEDVQVDAVVDALKDATDEARIAMIDILGRVQNSESLAALREELKNQSEAVRVAAAEALSGWKTVEPLADLSAIAYKQGPTALRGVAYAGHLKVLAIASMPASEKLTYYEKAMANAATVEDQRAVLNGLAKVADPGAFKIVSEISAPELRGDVQQTLVSLGSLLAGAMPAEVSDKMTEILASDTSDAIKGQAQAVLDLIAGLDRYLTAWAVAGPYFEEGSNATKIFEKTFPPQEHLGCDDNGAIVWSVAPLGLNREMLYMVDLEQAIGGSERVAFLKTCLDSDTAKEVTLALGSNDGCKVWLNGEELLSLNTGRPLTPGEDRIKLNLNAGKNALVVAVYQHGGAWGMTARLMGADGVTAMLP